MIAGDRRRVARVHRQIPGERKPSREITPFDLGRDKLAAKAMRRQARCRAMQSGSGRPPTRRIGKRPGSKLGGFLGRWVGVCR